MPKITGFQFPFYCEKHDFNSTIHTYCPFCVCAKKDAEIAALQARAELAESDADMFRRTLQARIKELEEFISNLGPDAN